MKSLVKPMILMSIILAVPIVPFILFGSHFERWFDVWSHSDAGSGATAGVIVAALSTDVFLPIPSSVISTMGGWKLGWLGGTLTSWVGMNLGAVLGFYLARRFGKPFASRLASPDELESVARMGGSIGPALLVLTRGIPVFAEAAVLLMGINMLRWRAFLVPVVLSNLGIAFAYSAFGDFAEQHQWLPLALGISIALPVLMATAARRWIFRPRDQTGATP